MFTLPDENTDPARRALYDSCSRVWLSYGDLASAVRDLTTHLQHPTKALVFCLTNNSLRSVVGYLAALEAGNAVALVAAEINREAFESLCQLYAPDMILDCDGRQTHEGQDREYERIPTPGGDVALWRAASTQNGAIDPDLSLLLSTSGSTGSPRYVRLSASSVTSNARSIRAALDITAGHRAITSLPIHYSYGLSVVNSHLAAGASIVLTDENVVSDAFWKTFRETECTSFAGVPYSYQLLDRLGIDALDVPSLTAMTQAGGRLSGNLVERFHGLMDRRGGQFFVMYGQTEATARISVLAHRDAPNRFGSVGRAIPGGRLEIEVDGSVTGEPGQVGEVVYTGPNVMKGYAGGRADLALGDEHGGRLRTGDLGCLDADGFLFLTGRIKRISKLFGHRINLDEVESQLKQHGSVAVVPAEDRIVVFCEFGDAQILAIHARDLAKKLRVNYRAIEFRRVDALPRTPNGKTDYQTLMQAL